MARVLGACTIAVILLAACEGGEGERVVADTDLADTEPVDSDPLPVCLEPLDPPTMPTTWAGVVARGETACLRTSLCDPGSGRAVARAFEGECEGSRTAYYDAGGSLFAEHVTSDEELPEEEQTCAGEGADLWRGEVVAACSDAAAAFGRGTPGCARPVPGPPLPAEGCVLPGPRAPSVGDVAAFAQTTCVGLATCTLGDRTLVLVLGRHARCAEHHLDAWDRATGELVATLEVFGQSDACGLAPHWVGLDPSPCFPATFTPSAACGVVPLPA